MNEFLSEHPPSALFLLWDGTHGGAENYSYRLIQHLRGSFGIDARLLFLSEGGALGETAVRHGAPSVSLSYTSGVAPLFRTSRLRQYLTDFAPGIVFLAEYGTAVLCLRRAGYSGRIAVIQHSGNVRFRNHPGTGLTVLKARAFRKVLSSRVDCEIAVSRFMAHVQSTLPHCSNLIVIRNGVDTRTFRPASESEPPLAPPPPLLIAAAGRLIPEKGFDLLLLALRSCLDSGTDVRTGIAGDGPDRARLERMARDLQLDDHVRFYGRLVDMPDFWRRHHVACVPSTRRFVESFCVTAAEAMACGLPVVATGLGALPEILPHDVAGLVVAPDDSSALAQALNRYAQDAGLLRSHSLHARMHAETELPLALSAARYAAVINGTELPWKL